MLFTAQVDDHEAAPSIGRLPTTTSGSPSPLPYLSASPVPSPAGCDYLTLDNQRVHAAADTKAYVQALLDYHGVKLRFLPAYSPELNPCELVFAEVKRRLRTEPRLFQSFWRETLRHFACITHRMVNSYYKHCLLAPLGR